jgi:hypothetical protein
MLDTLIGMLIHYEDYEDVVTGVYEVLHLFVKIAA